VGAGDPFEMSFIFKQQKAGQRHFNLLEREGQNEQPSDFRLYLRFSAADFVNPSSKGGKLQQRLGFAEPRSALHWSRNLAANLTAWLLRRLRENYRCA
jgi:hypothetical protein